MTPISERLRAYRPYQLPEGEPFGPKVCTEAADIIDALVEALDGAWAQGTTMRNASKLVGPYPNDPKATKVWARSLYHQGKDLHALLKPARAIIARARGAA